LPKARFGPRSPPKPSMAPDEAAARPPRSGGDDAQRAPTRSPKRTATVLDPPCGARTDPVRQRRCWHPGQV